MTCKDCGREPEGGVETHYIGCEMAVGRWVGAASEGKVVPLGDGLPPEDQCAKDGCANPRAPQGKSPRPKYCIDHKTGKKEE